MVMRDISGRHQNTISRTDSWFPYREYRENIQVTEFAIIWKSGRGLLLNSAETLSFKSPLCCSEVLLFLISCLLLVYSHRGVCRAYLPSPHPRRIPRCLNSLTISSSELLPLLSFFFSLSLFSPAVVFFYVFYCSFRLDLHRCFHFLYGFQNSAPATFCWFTFSPSSFLAVPANSGTASIFSLITMNYCFLQLLFNSISSIMTQKGMVNYFTLYFTLPRICVYIYIIYICSGCYCCSCFQQIWLGRHCLLPQSWA